MNKKQALVAMIEGKKVVDTSRKELHYYFFNGSTFEYSSTSKKEVATEVPESKFEYLVRKRTLSKELYVTERAIGEIDKSLQLNELVINARRAETSKARVKITISWQEEE